MCIRDRFCDFHGLARVDGGMVEWTVRHHLLMSMTAQRKDISDVDVIREFADTVSSTKHLNHLYLLTVADMRATNPELWNSFKQNLLYDLYETTRRWLLRGPDDPLDKGEILSEKKQAALQLLSTSDFQQDEIFPLWEQLGDTYHLRYQPNEIARHTETILGHKTNEYPLIRLRTSVRRGSTEVFVFMPDHERLFANVTAVLGNLNLDIQSAIITTTTSGFALDSFFVLDEAGQIIEEPARIEHIKSALEKTLSDTDQPHTPITARVPRILRHFDIQPMIEINTIESVNQSSVHIDAVDQPGLLSAIARVFSELDLQINDARIVTLGERIEDTFFVSDQDGNAVTEEDDLKNLRTRLLEVLEDHR